MGDLFRHGHFSLPSRPLISRGRLRKSQAAAILQQREYFGAPTALRPSCGDTGLLVNADEQGKGIKPLDLYGISGA
jgi:hypothetical protein